ncbi:MAG: SGNH/GDSL hydrolase family protein, partial [Saprospiraceae bacterium]|nr:SGNH/GDSL hydrolase family protein [Saprospiraceae bacterium]
QDASAKKKAVSSQSLNQKTAVRAMQVVAMFSFMAIFWTLWSSPTLSDWWNLVLKAFQAPFGEWMQLALRIFGLVLAAFVGFRIFEIPQVKAFMEPDEGKTLSIFWGGLTLSFFALLTIPSVLTVFQTWVDKPIEYIYETRLNEQDDADMIRGYYEDLLITNQLSSPLADIQNRPTDWVAFPKTALAVKLDNWLRYGLKPGVQAEFKKAQTSTNQWGMRDREYTKEKPANTIRIGILGGSYSMGSGVNDGEVFDEVLEDALNADPTFNTKFELLNFSVPGYQLMETAYMLENKALDFDLDMVVIVSHGVDFGKVGKALLESYRDNLEIDLTYVQDFAKEVGLQPGQQVPKDRDLFIKYGEPIVEASYAFIAKLCAERNIKTVVVHWPRTKDNIEPLDISEVLKITAANNFLNIDLAAVYLGQKPEDISLNAFDQHPNKLGHQLIARALLKEFESNPALLELVQQAIEN